MLCCVVCPSPICGFWLLLWYLRTLLINNHIHNLYNDLVKFSKAAANYYVRISASVSTSCQIVKLCLDQLVQSTLRSNRKLN
jgi:hypothetical protein